MTSMNILHDNSIHMVRIDYNNNKREREREREKEHNMQANVHRCSQ